MSRPLKQAIVALVVAAGLTVSARAGVADDDGEEGVDPTAADEAAPPMVGAETVELWGERPDKPFRRDTRLELTGAELGERGVTDLAEALALVPELEVVYKGRGGMQVNIRGARKGAIKIIVDGVPVAEPYYGTFDISTMPVTDIEQIRVSLSPSSPVDGVGGPGGVIEVHTRDAIGARLARLYLQGSDLPAANLSATVRHALSESLAARASVAALLSGEEYDLGDQGGLDEDRRGLTGGLRLEYRRGGRRVLVDGLLQHHQFAVNPGDQESSLTRVVDGLLTARLGVVGDLPLGGYRLQGRAHWQRLDEDSTSYDGPLLDEVRREEQLSANRVGAGFLVNRPVSSQLWLVGSGTVDSDSGDLVYVDTGSRGGGRATISALAAGLQYEAEPLRVDVAAGIAMPIGIGEGPWPEAKAALAYAPLAAMTLTTTLAHKGRMPTLRELYSSDIGNEELDPEIASFAEVAVDLAPLPWLSMRVASYLRYSDGIIRFDGERRALINIDDLTFRGVDATVEVGRGRSLGGGATWSFTDEFSARLGTDTLALVPMHRATLWFTGRLRQRGGATLRLTHVGDQTDNGVDLAAFTNVELGAHYRLRDDLMATLRIDNLADDRYLMRSFGVRSAGRVATLALLGEWR